MSATLHKLSQQQVRERLDGGRAVHESIQGGARHQICAVQFTPGCKPRFVVLGTAEQSRENRKSGGALG